MRIAMFTETFLPGTDGIVTRLCATLRHLERAGHEVLLFAPNGAPAEYASAKIVGIPAYPFFLYPEKKFALPLPVISRELKAFAPDLVHTVNPAFLGLGALYYGWKYRLPLVASYHTNVPSYARHYRVNWLEPALWWYFRTMHNCADVNLCTSRATLTELKKQRFHNLGLWERGVDVSMYRDVRVSPEMRQRLAPTAKEGDRILLYVGRLASEKGLERLRPLLDTCSNVHLAIVGDGPHRHALESTFASSNTVFTGYMHGEELARAYASSDAFLFPSVTETLGLVLFEAMASGLPILAADSPPTREVLEEGAAGIIFNGFDTAAMVAAVQTLFDDAGLRTRVRARGLEIAEELDWAGPTRQLVDHYQALLQSFATQHESAPVRDSQWQ